MRFTDPLRASPTAKTPGTEVCVVPGATLVGPQDCTTEPSATFTRSTRTGVGWELVIEYASRWPRLPSARSRLSGLANSSYE